MRFMAVCSMAMFVMACSEDPETPDNPDDPNNGDIIEEPQPDKSPVELKSVVFYAADNSAYMSEDVAVETVVEEKDGDMVVRIVGGGAGKELTMTLTAGANNIVTVDGAAVECADTEGGVEGKVKFDATFPADITVANQAGDTKKYVVKVGKVLETVVEQIASYTEPDCTISNCFLAVNPKDNTPYVAYTRKSATGSVDQGAVIKWNGTAFDAVGPLGFTSDAKKASLMSVTFDMNGVPYVIYYDATISGNVVKKLGAGSWEDVGAGLSKASSSAPANLMFNPANNMPVALFQGNDSTTGTRREMVRAEWNGSEWAETLAHLAPAVNGSANVYTASQSVLVGDALYVAATYTTIGYFVYKFQNGMWTTIVDPTATPYYAGTTPHAGYVNIFADAAGNVYVAGGSDAAKAGSWDVQIWKLDEANNTLLPYGPVAPVGFGTLRETMSAGVNPVTGEVAAVYKDQESDLVMYSTINEDLQWNPFMPLNSMKGDNTALIHVKFGSDGVGYALFLVAEEYQKDEDGKTVKDENGNSIVTIPASLELFRIGLEKDELPE